MISSKLLLLFLVKSIYSYGCLANKECATGCCYYGECDSGFYCTTKAIGEYCISYHECLTGYCYAYTCAESQHNNSCFLHSECISGCCYQQYCGPTKNCDTLLGEGGICVSDYECASLECLGGFCTKGPVKLLGLNEKCKAHEECASFCCHSDWRECIENSNCKHYPIGEYCFYDHICDSDYCLNHHCASMPDISAGTKNFINIGLPIIGVLVITAGITIMLKYCKKKLLNGRELDLEQKNLTTANPNSVTTNSIIASSSITPNAVAVSPA